MSLPLAEALDQCQRHANVLKQNIALLPAALSGHEIEAASVEQVRLVDQFVFRFMKLQDTLGAQVLRPFVVDVLAEPAEDLAFIDLLGVLEQRDFIVAQDWIDQRKLCNALTHEYPNDPVRQAEVLTDALQATPTLLAWLDRIAARAAQGNRP